MKLFHKQTPRGYCITIFSVVKDYFIRRGTADTAHYHTRGLVYMSLQKRFITVKLYKIVSFSGINVKKIDNLRFPCIIRHRGGVY